MIKERTEHVKVNAVVLLTICLISMFILVGCVERKLIVKSNPPGADVYFNNNHIGKTPVNFDFKWYWTHKVELKKEGYKTVTNYETIKAPPYMWIPFDLAAELLPFKIRDYRNLSYSLEPLTKSPKKENQEDISKEEFDFNK